MGIGELNEGRGVILEGNSILFIVMIFINIIVFNLVKEIYFIDIICLLIFIN